MTSSQLERIRSWSPNLLLRAADRRDRKLGYASALSKVWRDLADEKFQIQSEL